MKVLDQLEAQTDCTGDARRWTSDRLLRIQTDAANSDAGKCCVSLRNPVKCGNAAGSSEDDGQGTDF